MPIEFACTSCGQTLRVADEHAGKTARCPKCGALVPVSVGGAAPSPPASLAPTGIPPVALPGGLQGQPEAYAEPSSNPYVSPTASPFDPRPAVVGRPHRGGLIMALGLIGILVLPLAFLCCGPLGLVSLPFCVVAWLLGSSDLRAMQAGSMDPQGRGLTQAGQIMGIIGTVLSALLFLLFLGFIAVGVLGGLG